MNKMELKSQHKQDEFVINHFKQKKRGIFLDIGAHDGISLSNTFVLEKEFGWTGICIEPMEEEYNRLVKHRNCITYNCAIYDTNGTEKFTQVETMLEYDGYPDMLSGITKEIPIEGMSAILSESQRLGAKMKIIDVSTRILNEILEENKIYEIDFLSIDTEGSELKILKSIDYDKFHIKVITCEYGKPGPDLKDFLQSKNFSFIKKLGGDEIFINKLQ